MFEISENSKQLAKIKVFGIGGGGCNAVNTMIISELDGVDFISANTDAQALRASKAPLKLQLGQKLTKGLGASADPGIGKNAAEEDINRIREALTNSDTVIIVAAMGGGTGTGGAPVVAEISKELGALTVGIVTKPFLFEGRKRQKAAEEGIMELKKVVDILIVVPNQRLLSITGKNIPLLEILNMSNKVLFHAVRGISDLIMVNGLIDCIFP